MNLSDLQENKEEKKFYYLYDRLKKRISKEEYQKRIDLSWRWFEKFLRKIRISFLKFDNKIVFLLSKLREKNIETDIDKNIQADNMEECDALTEEAEKNENSDFQKQEISWRLTYRYRTRIFESVKILSKENHENRKAMARPHYRHRGSRI